MKMRDEKARMILALRHKLIFISARREKWHWCLAIL